MIDMILMWLKNLITKKNIVKFIPYILIVVMFIFGITQYKKYNNVSKQLILAKNNIEAYLDAINGSLLAFGVLKLDMDKLALQNDSLINKIDSIRKLNKIKTKHLTTAATHTLNINVNKSKGVGGDIITILKDTTYSDSILYNDLTKVFYTIGKDSVNVKLDIQNTLYLYIYKKKVYKNHKSFFKRLITFDWKKEWRYKYDIINTNDLLKEKDIRIIESNKI